MTALTRADIIQMDASQLRLAVANEIMGGSPVKLGPAYGLNADEAHYSDLLKDVVWNAPHGEYPGFLTVPVPDYPNDIAAAFEVLNKSYSWDANRGANGVYEITYTIEIEGERETGYAADSKFCIAVSRAALLARCAE